MRAWIIWRFLMRNCGPRRRRIFSAFEENYTMAKDKVRTTDLARMKVERIPIATLTAYDFAFAGIFDAAGVDVLLVSDSLGMVIQGADHTLAVTLDEVIYHTKMVARARRRALLIADLPFLTYQVSVEQALVSSGRLIKEGGAEAVKLEGGVTMSRDYSAHRRHRYSRNGAWAAIECRGGGRGRRPDAASVC
jgi:hypothetical protein